MLGRLIDGTFVPYDNIPVSIYIANPTEEQLGILGYKPLVEQAAPFYNELTQSLMETYEETADSIVKTYKVIDIEETQE